MMYTITSTAAAELLNGKLEMVCLCTYTELKGYVYYYTRHTGSYTCNGNKIAICVCMLHVEREGERERERREMERKGVNCRLIYGFIHAYERDCHKERLALMKTNIPRCLCTSKGEWVYVKLP